MTVVLQADDLHRSYAVRRGLFAEPATVQALAGVSFSVEAGQTLAVVGESGCGKSTLARVLTMIEPPSAGRLLIDGADVAHADAATRRALRHAVQIVFQNPYGSLNPRQTVGNALMEPLQAQGMGDPAAREQAAREMLRRVGLRAEHFGRYPHMFSGGQRQRVAIARALMPGPRLLVLDEPVSALDVSVRAQVLNLLSDLQRELSVAYVFISHDLGVVRHMADAVLVMYLGRAVEHSPRAALFAAPRHPYTEALLSATPTVDAAARRQRVVLKGETAVAAVAAVRLRLPHALPDRAATLQRRDAVAACQRGSWADGGLSVAVRVSVDRKAQALSQRRVMAWQAQKVRRADAVQITSIW